MYNQSKHKNKKHFCRYCLQCFSSERILANHVNNCLMISGNQAINMMKKGENMLRFNNFHKQLPVPFVIYADFEAITKKVQGCKQSEEMEKEKEKRSYTEAYQTHKDCGYGYNSDSARSAKSPILFAERCTIARRKSSFDTLDRFQRLVGTPIQKLIVPNSHCFVVVDFLHVHSRWMSKQNGVQEIGL